MKVGLGTILLRVLITLAALWVMGNYELWACSYVPSDPLHQEKQECGLRPDRSWSCQLHRCLATPEVLATQKAFERCNAIEEKAEGNRCRAQVAKEITEAEKGVDLNQNRVNTKNRFGMSIHSFLGAYYIFSGFSMTEAKKHCAISAQLMAAGSGAAVLGTLLASWQHKRGSGQLQDQYQKLVDNSHPQSAQVEAFDYLIEEQHLLEKVAKRFSQANYLAGGLLTSAAIAASYGMLVGIEGGCGVDSPAPPSPTPALPSPTPPGRLQVFWDMAWPTAQAGFLETLAPGGAGLGLAGLIAYGKNKNLKGLRNLLKTPPGRVVLASVGAAASFHAATLYRRESHEAKRRKGKIQEMRDAFVKRVGFYDCPGRKDPRQPQCFCFIRENLLNPEHKSSKTCREYFDPNASKDKVPGPENYVRGQGSREVLTGCLTRQGAFDPQCRCRKKRSSSGDNNCRKTAWDPSTFSFGGLGPSVGKWVKMANGLTSGEKGLDTLRTSSLGQGAVKLRRALKKISYLADKKLKKQGKRGFPFNDTHIRKGMAKVRKALGPRGMSLAKGFSGAFSSSPLELSPSQESALKEVSSKALPWKKRKKDQKANGTLWGFNDQKRDTSSEIEYGKEEYDYGNHDTHPEEGASLWEIIGHRYRNTGLSRLFE